MPAVSARLSPKGTATGGGRGARGASAGAGQTVIDAHWTALVALSECCGKLVATFILFNKKLTIYTVHQPDSIYTNFHCFLLRAR